MSQATRTPAQAGPPRRYVLPRSPGALGRRIYRQLRGLSDRALLGLAVAVVLAATAWCFMDPDHAKMPPLAVIIMVLASLVLGARAMLVVVGLLLAACLLVSAFHVRLRTPVPSTSAWSMILAVAAVAVVQARRRDRLGLRRRSAESVLHEVGQQLRTQSTVPEMPRGWYVNLAQRSAGGAAFAGDFVSSRVHGADGSAVLDLAMVDVSGRGFDAGSRALLLSGAVGGLLGEVSPCALLASTNAYLRRQDWGEHYATAIYVRIDLASGAYQVRCAGHPPALRWNAVDRTVTRSGQAGTLLGVVDEIDITPASGVLLAGDALVIFTDGVVEARSVDLDTGIADLEAVVSGLLRARSMRSLADQIVRLGAGDPDDDRTVIVVWNDGSGMRPGADRS